MAEVKNSFLQSKMNKDLDDRLIPNGQYREALNVSIGKSESNNVGVLQNVLGNAKLNVLSTVDAGLTCVGAFMDNQNNRIYQFLTNYTDLTPENITLCDNITPPVGGWVMKITVYDFNTNPQYKTLVSGTFLNLSTTNLIIGVNLVEGLLFWTDNRNQPRKINVESAINNPLYYTTETQISVAKYAPIDPISMFRKATVTVTVIDTEKLSYGFEIITGELEVGMTLVTSTMPENGYTTIVGFPNEDAFVLYTFDNTISEGDTLTFLTSTMTNKSDDPTWPGDPSFLEDKYVRFSYRFKFDDNEYSLIAPFTQIAYIPKQKGYFINGDEASAYKSTVLSWMENNVNNIELLIPLPDTGNNIRDSYKIVQLDVLYKESDALTIKVLESIDYTDIRQSSPDNNVYEYSYQSQKPFKTLPEDQITRVYDNVPVRALGQEIVGNRVVYGNFYNTYSPPTALNYNTTILPKSGTFTNFIEYPNHTVKQNRNYQVGFILADKFGRQSSVILSTIGSQVVEVGDTIFGGSTLYAPYEEKDSINIPSVKNWFGNAIVTIVNDPIDSIRDIQAGTPGLYAQPTSSIGFIVTSGSTSITDTSYQFIIDSTPGQVVPAVGDSLRGAHTDYVTVVPKKSGDPNPSPPTYFIRTSGRINDLYLSNPENSVDTKFSYKLNQIGWYSYRIVVKQQQQEYYNVYLPGMLDGYPVSQTNGSQVTYDEDGVAATQNGINTTDFPVGEIGKTSHIVLINDNINKVPRDLVEVGPDQKLYRSSVSLYGKVENSATILKVIADIDYLDTNPLATSIVYKLEDNIDILNLVVSGNGIQSDEANEEIDNPAIPPVPLTIKNPKAWYANTVVTSNELYSFTVYNELLEPTGETVIRLKTPHEIVIINDEVSWTIDEVVYYAIVTDVIGDDITIDTALTIDMPINTELKIIRPTHGIITFTPPNWTVEGVDIEYLNYTITKAENIQYFPTRKADIVTAIATANDFNFLENDVNNIKGTAGLNFYQLQTRPSIGRVSVVNTIGVIGEKMVPFLSVYETTPVTSALQLFWETTSTGLISDLNYDVLVGYDGPVGTSDIDFVFYENQDKDGTNPVVGEPDSKWITNSFTLLNSTGIPISFIGNPVLVSVFDNSSPNTDVTSKFGVSLNEDLDPSTIRLFIKDSFVFTHDSPNSGSYTFLIKLEWSPGKYFTLPIKGRLRNNTPLFSNVSYDTEISVPPGPFTSQFIVNVSANNGSFSESTSGMQWSILTGDLSYFQIESTTGNLSLINQSIPLGSYNLRIKIQDAMSGGSPLNGGGTSYFGSLQDDIDIIITVVAPRVDEVLVYETTDPFVWDKNPECSGSEVIGQGYAVYHIGSQDLSLTNGFNSLLPDITQTNPPAPNRLFQNYVNPAIANGTGGSRPVGLTQGSLEWVLTNYGANLYPPNNLLTSTTSQTEYISTQRQGDLEYILYYKPTVSDTWVPVKNDNGFPILLNPTNPEWSSVVDLEMSVYHFTWLKTSSNSPSGASQVIFDLPPDQPRPKTDDFIDLGYNGIRRVASVIISGETCVVSLTSTLIAALSANVYYRVARVPFNSLNNVYKQTSFTTSTPGEYCLALKYTYRRDVNQYIFDLTVAQFTLDARYNVYIRGKFPAPVVGDTVVYRDTGTTERVATVNSFTWNESLNAYAMTFSYSYSVSDSNAPRINQGENVRFIRSFPKNLYCGTVDFYGKVATRDVNVYDVTAPKYELALVEPGENYPYSRLNSDRTVGFDYVYPLVANAQTEVSNEIQLVDLPSDSDDILSSMFGPIIPGVYIGTSGYANWVDDIYFNENTQVTNINTTTKVITISSNTKVVMPSNTKIYVFSRPDSGIGSVGYVWASSNNGMNITQFYSNETLTNPWVPYSIPSGVVYRNSDRSYNNTITDGPITWSTLPPVLSYISIMPLVTNKPFFSGLISTTAGAIGPVIAAETAWAFNQKARLTGQGIEPSASPTPRLVDTLARFVLNKVEPNDVVYNISTGEAALVVSVINETTLQLSERIFTPVLTSEYIIVPKIGIIEDNEYLKGNLNQLRSI